MKERVDYVFVVLVYRNHEDLIDFIHSANEKVKKKKIIVVNAYYDNASKNRIEAVAKKYNCIFLNIENKGYSYGNNYGIHFAIEHFDYKYIVISNPDIIIENFPLDARGIKGDIIASKTIAASGKNQNPMIVKENALAEKLIYIGFIYENKFFLMLGIALNKIRREFFLHTANKNDSHIYKIYAAHGSFLLLSKKAICKLGASPYDENMFLFAEESVLALKAKKENLITTYMPSIVVKHKEDGSMKLGDISVNNELAKANIYYYETYRMKR